MNKAKKKRSILGTILFVLLMATAISSCYTAGVFARYVTQASYIGETPISDWGFDLRVNGYVDGETGDTETAEGIVSGMDLATAKDTVYNTDEDAYIKKGTVAFGSAGYMPVEIKWKSGQAAEVSLVINIKAYFVNLPDGMVFTDNLGQTLDKESNATGYTFTGSYAGKTMTAIEYSYYLSYEEVAQWTDDGYINLGFRWAWKNNTDDDTNNPNIGTAVVVTANQVLSAMDIPQDAYTINFANALADDADNDKYGLVLDDASTVNILMADLDDKTITPTKDFYLDVNGKATGTYTIKAGDDVEKIVAGTFRRDCDYEDEDDRPIIVISDNADPVGITTAHTLISRDFKVAYSNINAQNYKVTDLVDILNGILFQEKANTPYDALDYIIDNIDGEFDDYSSVPTTVSELSALIEDTGDAHNYILWDTASKRFVAMVDGVYYQTETTKDIYSIGADYTLFRFYDAMPSTQTYSIYLTGTAITGTISNLTTGLDVGENSGITEITYDRHAETTAKSIIIRTNAFTTILNVNGYVSSSDHSVGDVVTHYGMAGAVEVIQCATSSYDEYGIVGRLTATASDAIAHIDIKEGAKVFQVEQSTASTTSVTVEENAIVYDIEGNKVEEYINASTTKFSANNTEENNKNETITADECKHENGLSVMCDDNHVFEFCKTCGYTVIRIKNTSTQDEVIKTVSDGTDTIIIPKATYSMNQSTTAFDDLADDDASGEIELDTLVQDKENDTETTGTDVVPAVENTPVIDSNQKIDITCNHSWTTVITKSVTCTETGIETTTCSNCGAVYTTEISKIAHNYQWNNVKGNGQHTLICSGCSDSKQESCDTNGEGGECSVCGYNPKGMLITMNLVKDDSSLTGTFEGALSNGNETYRILKMDGTKALVVAMYVTRLGEPYYPSAGAVAQTTFENSNLYTKYEDSPLDTYLEETFYSDSNLTDEAYVAIVETDIYQSAYSRNTGSPSGEFKYGYQWLYGGNVNQCKAKYVSQVEVSDRHVYALDLKDIYEYFGKDSVTLDELFNLFYNCDAGSQATTYGTWLRTASAGNPTGDSKCAWQFVAKTSMAGLTTYGATWNSNNSPAVSPAFEIDLSQITWSEYSAN